MSVKLANAAFELEGLSLLEHFLLTYVAWRFNDSTHRCNPDIDLLARKAGVSRRHVIRGMNGLVERGLLIRYRHVGRGHYNDYDFGAVLRSPDQGRLWAGEKVTPTSPFTPPKGDTSVAEKVTPMSRKGDTSVTLRKKDKRSINDPLPKGRRGGDEIAATAGYRAALEQIPESGNAQGATAILIRFTESYMPASAKPGRLGILANLYGGRAALVELWAARDKAVPLDYVQAVLGRRKAEPADGRGPAVDQAAIDAADAEWVAQSSQGRGHRKEGDE